jgi:hypothetical protein
MDGGIWYNLRSFVWEIVPFPGGVMVFEKGRRAQDAGLMNQEKTWQ